MARLDVHGRERDYLATTDLSALYGPPETSTTNVADYYNQPEPVRGNRRQRRAAAAQKRRKTK